jgi:hypothetical protein
MGVEAFTVIVLKAAVARTMHGFYGDASPYSLELHIV